MKTYVSDLVPGSGSFVSFFVLTKKEFRDGSNGTYLSASLKDSTGEVDAKRWDTKSIEAEVDTVVKVKGSVELYKGKNQVRIDLIRPAADYEFDIADMVPCSAIPPATLLGDIKFLVDLNTNDTLRLFLHHVLDCQEQGLLRAPAAKYFHHAYVGGLLTHILDLIRAAVQITQLYAHLDLGILIAAAICHDIGKVRELSGGLSFNYTTNGKLFGHILMGFEIVRSAAIECNLPEDTARHICHIIASHHGELEYGAAVLPQTREAIVFHHLDMIDSRLAAIRIQAEAAAPEDEFTAVVPILKSPIWKGKQCPKNSPDSVKPVAAIQEIPPPCPPPTQQDLIPPPLPANFPE